MISMDELLSNQAILSDLDAATQNNLNDLLIKINKIRTSWAKPMKVTSGLRTMKHHLAIYAAKGITDKSKIPMKSNHLYGRAVDISDPNRELQKWCKANEPLLVSIGLWMEDFSKTPTWCHFQTVAPASGNRWFMP
jgi:uncharacterized protein YcbK (DUF882 family)